jgi:hypothetical protein
MILESDHVSGFISTYSCKYENICQSALILNFITVHVQSRPVKRKGRETSSKSWLFGCIWQLNVHGENGDNAVHAIVIPLDAAAAVQLRIPEAGGSGV